MGHHLIPHWLPQGTHASVKLGAGERVERLYVAKFSPVAAGLLVAASLSSTAGAVSAANDKPAQSGLQAVTYQPPPGIRDRIGGLRINVIQVNYPGVPERSACRLLVRATNEGDQKIGAHALIRTFDTYKASLNSWLVPTGELAPGQTVERIYSCKMAQSLVLDQGTGSGWPGRCTVDGTEVSPCPAALHLETNVQILKDLPGTDVVKAK